MGKLKIRIRILNVWGEMKIRILKVCGKCKCKFKLMQMQIQILNVDYHSKIHKIFLQHNLFEENCIDDNDRSVIIRNKEESSQSIYFSYQI